MKSSFFAIFLPFWLASSSPLAVCPSWLQESGVSNDMGLLSEMVSMENTKEVVGVCGHYSVVLQVDGLFDTRMRV